MMTDRSLGRAGLPVSRLGLGLAAVARPGYITLGRARDLPANRSPEALYERCAALLDEALGLGIRYVDVARSYGRAEEFLARWIADKELPPASLTVGSKWGYRYTGDWRVDAEIHEQKELSLERFTDQLEESRRTLGGRIDLYQIHSATLESGVLDDDTVVEAMVSARRAGHVRSLGLTLSGTESAKTLERALDVRVGSELVFDTVQATCNILEPSLLPLLARAREHGMGVLVKEVHANGRLTPANQSAGDRAVVKLLSDLAGERGLTIDQLAIAFVLDHDCVDVVNSGAATVDQLRSHAAAVGVVVDDDLRSALRGLAEEPSTYWSTRSKLSWS